MIWVALSVVGVIGLWGVIALVRVPPDQLPEALRGLASIVRALAHFIRGSGLKR